MMVREFARSLSGKEWLELIGGLGFFGLIVCLYAFAGWVTHWYGFEVGILGSVGVVGILVGLFWLGCLIAGIRERSGA